MIQFHSSVTVARGFRVTWSTLSRLEKALQQTAHTDWLEFKLPSDIVIAQWSEVSSLLEEADI